MSEKCPLQIFWVEHGDALSINVTGEEGARVCNAVGTEEVIIAKTYNGGVFAIDMRTVRMAICSKPVSY